jgi:CRP-like cAMP-binding protein
MMKGETRTALGPATSENNGAFRNRLLAALSDGERRTITPHLERVSTKAREVFYDPDAPIAHVDFLEEGLGSIVSAMSDGSAVETATVGAEGMIGLPVFHGVDGTAEQALTQIPAVSWRLDAGTFRELLPQLPTLEKQLHRYSAFLFTLAAQNSGCNRKHSVEQRCARWLSIVVDQTGSTELALTHDFISQMLGVRRASVTETLAIFQRSGWIETRRARLRIIDRAALEGATCTCYGIITAAARRMIDGAVGRSPLDEVVASRNGMSVFTDGTPATSSTDEPQGVM